MLIIIKVVTKYILSDNTLSIITIEITNLFYDHLIFSYCHYIEVMTIYFFTIIKN